VDKTTRQNTTEKVLSGSPGAGNIPDKLYFKIGEVKKITGVEPHVLRYWESEFKIIRPQRASSKQRLYRRVDVENILRIKKLLYEDGYTVPGARKLLTEKRDETEKERKKESRPQPKIPGTGARSMLAELRSDLKQLQEMLEKK
jgi:DNA-binding transcriptional MerR regulator